MGKTKISPRRHGGAERNLRAANLAFYFSAAAVGLALVFGDGLAAAEVCKDARRARVLTRLAACDRLRVFLRALVFGMGSRYLIFKIEMRSLVSASILR